MNSNVTSHKSWFMGTAPHWSFCIPCVAALPAPGRVKWLLWRPCGPQISEYLLSGLLEKVCPALPWSEGGPSTTPRAGLSSGVRLSLGLGQLGYPQGGTDLALGALQVCKMEVSLVQVEVGRRQDLEQTRSSLSPPPQTVFFCPQCEGPGDLVSSEPVGGGQRPGRRESVGLAGSRRNKRPLCSEAEVAAALGERVAPPDCYPAHSVRGPGISGDPHLQVPESCQERLGRPRARPSGADACAACPAGGWRPQGRCALLWDPSFCIQLLSGPGTPAHRSSGRAHPLFQALSQNAAHPSGS